MRKLPKTIIDPETGKRRKPRILMVTPEITYLPRGMGNMAQRLCAKAGGMADVSASLVKSLYDKGADVHVTLPNYRKLFNLSSERRHDSEYCAFTSSLPNQRIHLAQDRIFYHKNRVYDNAENHLLSLAFQREVINNVIPRVKPDLIHCNDWMTGLIPAVARRNNIKSLFTVHNIHTERLPLSMIEDRGIDAADFWHNLYFKEQPHHYHHARENNHVNLLVSGIFASDHVNSVSPTFLHEVVEGRHDFVPDCIRNELAAKLHSGYASGILNAPDPSYDPATDHYLEHNFNADTHQEGKRKNKLQFQELAGLTMDPNAPLLFWPSRLDPVQKGCQLLADLLYHIIEKYKDIGLQVAIVANGEFQKHFKDIVEHHGIHDRVSVLDFSENMSRLGYAASDFMLMPSKFEPCGLPQMVSPKYGSLPLVHDTGGIHDTVHHLHHDGNLGLGFRFQHYNTNGLEWVIDEAVRFYQRPAQEREKILRRIMTESLEQFNHETCAAEYIKLYESILNCCIVSH